MRKIHIIISLLTISTFLLQQANAQSPEKMSYQAVVRDANNELVSNQAVGMQISILQGSASGTSVYSETQNPTTNANGLVSVEIGAGTTSDDFSSIDWANGPYFIKTETDPAGGSSYTITGISRLMSVPYALHAKTAENVTGGISETDPVFGSSVATGITQADTANWNNHTVGTGSQPDLAEITALGFVSGAHTVDTDTQLDAAGVAALGYVAGPHIVDTQLDSSEIANLGYVVGSHTVDTQLDSTGVAALGFVAGGITETDPVFIKSVAKGITEKDTANWSDHTQIDSKTIAKMGFALGAHSDSTDIANMGFVAGSGSSTYSIGDFALGGVVFWVDESGRHGLVCTKENQTKFIRWYAGTNGNTRAYGDGPFSGEMNTSIIIAAHVAIGDDGNNYAARMCAELQITEGGKTYGDWYLPSIEELKLIFLNRAAVESAATANGGELFRRTYWSSTESDASNAMKMSALSGLVGESVKTNVISIRAVRAF